ncbi:glycosyltransferase family 4 protein [Cesiribacter andamanensis]|uniref:GDP-mannose-dependent alpha-(1-6)-phosphatidylinositol monomannoside mannosyltransferase n=1 Tax=Cesiribacter andamanensis AMV16 TaxID=1279009 RepID=M7N6S1_9BACT|nr:glycosyltransferase family 4 protein [Cesiribacter andamanensis]EMR02982.1 GDP-mannose-dependent alpha-(1-6)-phosphatidylinositol monomannoside mannosyltransferase [Cesiribacter andamanensis AMV16]
MFQNTKAALVHDWLITEGGAEKCVQSFLNVNPNFDLFSLIDFFPEEYRQRMLQGKVATTSFIQKLPTAQANHRKFLPLFPLAVEQFDLSQYDLILSSSTSVSKGVLTHSNQLHICYCHSPMRYAWDLYYQYLQEANLTRGVKGWIAKYILHRMRTWDVISSNRVDHFIANSQYIAKRIKKVYKREATVIYPPVDVESFSLVEEKEDFYLTASRMVPYKKIDLIVEAFSQLPDKRLIVIGDGPDMGKIRKKATKNIELLGYQPFPVLKEYMQRARAFVFAAEEDFGIIPVEAQACGTPVIAYGKGGSLETVLASETGTFFYQQTAAAIVAAVHDFERKQVSFDPLKIRKHAEKFSSQRFESEIKQYVEEKLGDFITTPADCFA